MRLLSIVGARPQFVKLGPLHREIVRDHEHMIVHTGQHYDYEMSQVFFDELEIPSPDFNLEVGSGSHGEQTGRMLAGIERVLMETSPDHVIVYGDTNSTIAGALAAAKLHVPVSHVEAGLRSYNRSMPEEINRVATDHISDLLLCPSQASADILRGEGLVDNVRVVGDVMVQGLFELEPRLDVNRLASFGVSPGSYVLATSHRQENVDDDERLGEIVRGMVGCGETVLFPAHPRTVKRLEATGFGDVLGSADNVIVTKPLDFITFTTLERFARAVLTDSGGVQKEAYTFRVPCVTMRDETEWVETVDEGWNVLVGADAERVVTAIRDAGPGTSDARSYGDDRVTRRIVDAIESL